MYSAPTIAPDDHDGQERRMEEQGRLLDDARFRRPTRQQGARLVDARQTPVNLLVAPVPVRSVARPPMSESADDASSAHAVRPVEPARTPEPAQPTESVPTVGDVVAFGRDVRAAVGERVVGSEETVSALLVGLLAGGHVLLEGVPGVAKTTLARETVTAAGLDATRIQLTPDLLPADITGTQLYDHESRTFTTHRGPIFSQAVVADEINRATPKAQSALLEAMAEGRVTLAGETHRLPEPFFVVATQNPVGMAGTYPLPEAQLDRFALRLLVEPPTAADEVALLATHGDDAEPAAPVCDAVTVLAYRRVVDQTAEFEGVSATRIVAETVDSLSVPDPDEDVDAVLAARFARIDAGDDPFGDHGVRVETVAGAGDALAVSALGGGR